MSHGDVAAAASGRDKWKFCNVAFCIINYRKIAKGRVLSTLVDKSVLQYLNGNVDFYDFNVYLFCFNVQ